MVNRVCFGMKGSDAGAWISKPGKNVLTAAESDMMFSTSAQSGQIVQSGKVTLPAGTGQTVSVALPPLAKTPHVVWGDNLDFLESTTMTITSSAVVFKNHTGGAITVRYVIFDVDL